MMKKAFGTYEIAQICNVTPATVGNWIEKGLLPTFRTGGGHRRVWARNLAEFLKDHNIPLPDDWQSPEPNLVRGQSPEPSARPESSLTLLIVDDEEPVRRMIRRHLRKARPELAIEEAEDGFEAGRKIARTFPALIILDLKLPGLDGFRVCRQIRQDPATEKTKVLAISGHDREESRRQALLSGADDFLAKPFDLRQLTRRISALLADRSKTRPLLGE